MAPRIDPHGGAGFIAMASHLTAPLAAGARWRKIPIGADGSLDVTFPTRRPLVQIALKETLANEVASVSASVPGGAGPKLPTLVFEAWSPAGAALPLLRPAGERVAPFRLELTGLRNGAPIAAPNLAALFEAVLIEGELGRLIATLAAEGARLQREARVVASMRRLNDARDDALDRHGADVGAPRAEGRLAWRPQAGGDGEIVVEPGVESDAHFRQRLAIYRPFVAPTPTAATALLRTRLPEVSLTESATRLAVAVRFVGVGGPQSRDALLARLRAERLIHPLGDAASNAVHAARYLPQARRRQVDALRQNIREVFDLPPGAAMAPSVAQALGRAARIVKALNLGQKLTIARAQDNAGGSRFEAGLGLAFKLPAVAVADTLRGKLLAARQPGGDAEAESLIQTAAKTAPPAGDATLAWLWTAAGFRTVHSLDAGQVYLSDLPVGGLTIDGPPTVAVGAAADYRAVFEAPADAATDASLAAALAAATAARAGAGAPDFKTLDPGQAAAVRAGAVNLPQGGAVANVLAGAGLPAYGDAAKVTAALGALPAELHRTLLLDAALGQLIRDGKPAAVAPLSKLVALMKASGVVSLLPLVTATDAYVVVGMTSLPVSGVNLGQRTATGVRWSPMPLGGAGEMRAVGFSSRFGATAAGAVAIAAIGHVRGAGPDPYEISCDLPQGRMLSLDEYEWLMNALERCFAMGVEINTWSLRQSHVDLDGDGAANPLPPRLSRHYRAYRQPRMRGLEEPEPS